MPLYEYECSSCNHNFDTIQKMDEDPLTKCPECGKDTLEKLIGTCNFSFRGEGFYETSIHGRQYHNKDK